MNYSTTYPCTSPRHEIIGPGLIRQRRAARCRQSVRATQVLLLGLLLSSAQQAAAFGSVGILSDCATFTTCTAEMRSNAAWSVVRELTNVTAGYSLPSGWSTGLTLFKEFDTAASPAPAAVSNGADTFPSYTGPFAAGVAAQARTNFGSNRGRSLATYGAVGKHEQAGGSATLEVRATAVAQSAWRDVLGFSSDGHFHADVAIDGRSAVLSNGFPPEFTPSFQGLAGNWSYELNVWDVTNLYIDPDGFFAPTPVATLSAGGAEDRSSFATTLALDFDFLSGASYVVTSRLETYAHNGREVDLYNTIRLQGIVLSGGASLTALSGHDYLAPVPEPSTWLLLAGGLAGLAGLRRNQRHGA